MPAIWQKMIEVVDPTLPRRPYDANAGDRSMVIDKNGVARLVRKNYTAAQEDAQRYQRKKEGEARMQTGYEDISGAAPPAAGGAGPMPPAAQGAKVQDTSWLPGLLQQYAADIPLRLSLDRNAPVVTPEMLAPTDERLAQMDQETREGLGRVFLSLVSKYYGDHTMAQAQLVGTGMRNFLPGQMVGYFNRLTGRSGGKQ